MTLKPTPHSSLATGRAAAFRARLAGFPGLASRWASAILRAIGNRRAVEELLKLDERLLRDIGLARSDVLGALAEPLVRDPSAILLVRSVDRRSRRRSPAVLRLRVTEPAS